MAAAHYPTGMPPKQGLYDPANEHDACGIGFIAHAKGKKSHDIVRKGLELLENLTHRGAAGCDPCSGDGAGILMQIPHGFFSRVCAEAGISLPGEGEYAAGMFFLPLDAGDAERCMEVVERVIAEEELALLGWREVPSDGSVVGPEARKTLPAIKQCFIARAGMEEDAFERKLFRTRKRIEKAIGASEIEGRGSFYVPSLSARTIVYKGLLIPDQIPLFYADLADPSVESAIALVHSRFSTNTFPTWPRSHPYRFICHNGEINALRGNVNWMRVREGGVHSHLFGDDPEALFPIIGENQSDSACLDNALEFLVMGGRSLPHAMMMLVPEAWTNHPDMDPEVHAFFEYHSAIMEPWDGPAAIAFSNGRQVGAVLDRNGLRPARYLVTHDDLVVLASEAGALTFAPEEIRAKGRLAPGKMLMVDTVEGRIWDDAEIKSFVASRQPYAQWVKEQQVRLEDLPESTTADIPVETTPLIEREAAFGYTLEELRMILAPMVNNGEEPTGSMGTDTPLAALSDRPQLLFKYFKQLFAQVTNPPIDPIRERLVMTLATELGPRADVLEETPEHAHRIWLEQPILGNEELARLRMAGSAFPSCTVSALFPVAEGAAGLGPAMERVCAEAAAAVRAGCKLVILSDRGVDDHHAPIPSLLVSAGVHHHLIREGLRTHVGLVLESGEPREVHHFAVLLGYGVEAINPYLVFETLEAMSHRNEIPVDARGAGKQFSKAIGKGLLKILSKMGISTLQSYCGAQIFEAIGISSQLVEKYFTGTNSRIGGVGLEEVAEEALRRHRAAFATPTAVDRLDPGGEYHYRVQGEHHNWSPLAIAKLQHATRSKSYSTFKEFSKVVNEEQARFNLRGLFEFLPGESIPIEEVEPASEIVKRFRTGAMSYGSISAEAHETLAVAMNRIGGRSNTGEGGEDPLRFLDDRNSKIKQVASGRFGVTTHYLVNAEELQIKIAQGAKPGEGGQLPGHKVDEIIAKTRHSTPGVSLISPPPHHDIYSIEDLKQLIYDLKTVNPTATVSVKLVAEVGVGTVAAGVAKAHADLIVIAGDSGGTGASPVSSIKYAGIPWELGLAETQQTLVLNDLRGRVRIQTDGQLRTGRDVAVAALLGAEEFAFATAPLIVEGCIMMRKCHLNTCPVGIATQDPVLRAKFTGEPEHIVNYFFFIAEEMREIMAQLGFRTVQEMVGRSDRMKPREIDHWKGSTLDLTPMLYRPDVDEKVALHCIQEQEHGLEESLDHELIRMAAPALERGERVSGEIAVRNTHRTVGAMLSGMIAKKHGSEGLPEDTVRIKLSGSAGQSFGAFAVQGLTLTLEGEANDYVGKGLSGGRLVIYPHRASTFVAEETIVVGNTVLYGATGGEAFFRGTAGERFAVRNSGAMAVVEGVGDHGCEYMTGGVVVVLGKTGRNFGAGMSGGIAFVLDEAGEFERSCNLGLVELERVEEAADAELLRHLVERHARYTGSERAKQVLESWEAQLPRFIKVIPVEYKQILLKKKALVRETEARHTARKEMAVHG